MKNTSIRMKAAALLALAALAAPFAASAANMAVSPVKADGSSISGSAASWADNAYGYVLVSNMPRPSGATGMLLDVFAAPAKGGAKTLLLEAAPSSASGTFPISPGAIAAAGPGAYKLVATYSFQVPAGVQSYFATSSMSVKISHVSGGGSSSGNCPSGYFQNVAGNGCTPVGTTGISPDTYNPAPTVDLNSGSPANTVSQPPAPANSGGGLPYGLSVCKGVNDPDNQNDSRPLCDFAQLIHEGQFFINWLFIIAVPLAIALFAYGGVLYITGVQANIAKAKKIFVSVGIGFGIMLTAWVLVYTIVGWLTTSGSGITSFLGIK